MRSGRLAAKGGEGRFLMCVPVFAVEEERPRCPEEGRLHTSSLIPTLFPCCHSVTSRPVSSPSRLFPALLAPRMVFGLIAQQGSISLSSPVIESCGNPDLSLSLYPSRHTLLTQNIFSPLVLRYRRAAIYRNTAPRRVKVGANRVFPPSLCSHHLSPFPLHSALFDAIANG